MIKLIYSYQTQIRGEKERTATVEWEKNEDLVSEMFSSLGHM